MFTTYKNIWFCGLAASGKTTVLRMMHKKFPKITYHNDSLEIINFVKNDTKLEHHKKPTPDSFVLTDSAATQYSIQQLIQKCQSSSENKIIELSRGLDSEGIVDFSYRYLFSQLPIELKKNSLFVYLYAPTEKRVERNMARPKLSKDATVFESFYCPEEAFNRFFLQDDFLEAINETPVDFMFIPNVYDLSNLEYKVETLFKHD